MKLLIFIWFLVINRIFHEGLSSGCGEIPSEEVFHPNQQWVAYCVAVHHQFCPIQALAFFGILGYKHNVIHRVEFESVNIFLLYLNKSLFTIAAEYTLSNCSISYPSDSQENSSNSSDPRERSFHNWKSSIYFGHLIRLVFLVLGEFYYPWIRGSWGCEPWKWISHQLIIK